jgi:hypothetical protein
LIDRVKRIVVAPGDQVIEQLGALIAFERSGAGHGVLLFGATEMKRPAPFDAGRFVAYSPFSERATERCRCSVLMPFLMYHARFVRRDDGGFARTAPS